MTETNRNIASGATLESWKEIAVYLQRDVSTVRRWEKEEGLPVHRHKHSKGSSVYAIPSELDDWRAARQPEPETAPVRLRPRRLAVAAGVVVALLGSGWVLWRKGVLRLPYPLVEAAESGMVARRIWAGKTNDVSSGASTDGRLVVFTDWSTGDLDAIELATGRQRRLLKGEWSKGDFAQGPVISPDGKLVAYSWWTSNRIYQLRLVPTAEDSQPRTLYGNPEVPVIFAAGWSGDGKQLLVKCWRRDGSAQIAMVAAASGALRVVKSFGRRAPGGLSLSPDGRYIAYDFPQAEEGPERDILLLATDGSREVPLVRHPGHDAGSMWTPDGSRVLFFSDRSGALALWSVSVVEGRAQGAPALIKADAGQMSPLGFGPKGDLLYAVPSGANDVLMVAEMDLETGRLRSEPVPVVSRYGGPSPNHRPGWSPDGDYLAYVVGKPSVLSRDGPNRVVVRDMKTGQEREMHQRFRGIGTAPKWRPDGKTVLVSGLPADGAAGTLQLDVGDGSASPLPGSQSWDGGCPYPQWSTTSDAVWCLQNDGIVRRKLDSGEETARVRFEHAGANNPLSPDGRWVAFRGKDLRTLNLASVEGGERREVFRLDGGNDHLTPLCWTPDSRYLLFRNEKGQMWRIQASGGAARNLAIPLKGLKHLTVNPDGKRVAMLAQKPGSEIWVLENFLPKTVAAR